MRGADLLNLEGNKEGLNRREENATRERRMVKGLYWSG